MALEYSAKKKKDGAATSWGGGGVSQGLVMKPKPRISLLSRTNCAGFSVCVGSFRCENSTTGMVETKHLSSQEVPDLNLYYEMCQSLADAIGLIKKQRRGVEERHWEAVEGLMLDGEDIDDEFPIIDPSSSIEA
eukprot:Skav213060  [mRNA]  locus=scaffold364:487347:487748:- [translate_table: standard]